MAETKHTPGPWQILKMAKLMTITGNIHQITDQDRYPSAFVPAWDNPAPGEKDGTNEALANAYLIAAAPDLLAALFSARATIQEDRDEIFDSVTVAGDEASMDEIDRPAVDRMDAILREIDAAIAKAEGQP